MEISKIVKLRAFIKFSHMDAPDFFKIYLIFNGSILI